MKVVSGKQMREIEKLAIEELGIPSILLMENAAIRLAEHCLKLINSITSCKTNDQTGSRQFKVLIVSGPGNNGGDGLALARLLQLKGVDTKVFYIGDVNSAINKVICEKCSKTSDASVYLAIVKNLGIPIYPIPSSVSHNNLPEELPDIKNLIESCDLVVDAMLGTGLDRDVEGSLKYLIEMINNHARYIISADIPSGIHSDSGQVMGSAVKAAETITFCSPKIGLYVYPGAAYAGKVHVEDITIPAALIDRVETEAEVLTDIEAKRLLPVRGQRSNKGSFGKVMVFAGSNEMPGAAALACSAAYITGGGLVCACVLPQVAAVIHHWQREVITRIVPEKNGMYCKNSLKNIKDEVNKANAIIIGPGIGRSPDVTEFVYELINMTEVPIVLDADALFALSENAGILKQLKAPCVITPHPGEMSRLTGLSVPDILNNIVDTAVSFSVKHNVITLLKDAHTIIANPKGKFYINLTGNNSLSKAGTGDVLTGMIAGFIAQGLDVFTASALGAYFHGKAGEAASASKSCYSVTAEDVLKYVGCLLVN